MGARTNFTFKTATGNLTLYSHWGGDTKFQDLAAALNAARPRLAMGDTPYALRITVSHLIGPSWDSETGYGLHVGSEGGEESYEPVTVDFTNNTVIHNGMIHSINDFITYNSLQLTEV
jgi:hypothetical protein